MQDVDKTQEQLLQELPALRRRVAELEAASKRYNDIFEHSGESIFVVDPATLRFLDVNANAARRLGYSRKELLQLTLGDVEAIDPDLLQGAVTWESTVSGTTFYESRHRRRDGSEMPVEVGSRLVQHGQGDVLLLFVRDITVRKEAVAQKQRLVAIEERERIGRELHDDLGQVMGYINVLAQASQELLAQGKTNQARMTLDQLIEAAQGAHTDIRRYILGIRADSQLPDAGASLEIASTDFVGVLEQYLNTLSERHDLKVDTSLPEGENILLSPEVGTQLLRIIQEALTNVLKHAAVDTARLYLFPDTEQVRVVIEDKGRGFIPGAVADPAAEKSALGGHGLNIMRERAESVGGTFKVSAKLGAGTRITVRVPKLVSASKEAMPGQGLRVLLVDDHPLFLEGIRTLLSVRGLQVVGAARDGLEAQEKARALLPDLILMDVEMPHCDGVEATRRIKAELAEVRVVMLTVAADDDTLFAALKAGASGYLLKSLASDEFYRLLGNIVRGEVVLAPELAARVLSEFQRPETDSAPGAPDGAFPELTAQQVEILDYVAQGSIYKEVAAQVHLSERTIRYHMGQILERLQLQNRRQAITYARRKGLGQPD